MAKIENEKIREKAYKDYLSGMKYKEIADKYDVSINTVKSWKTRYKWQRCITHKNVGAGANLENEILDLENDIRKDLLHQLERSDNLTKYYIDLVEDYIDLWKIKNDLIKDVKKRGVQVEYQNGKDQWGMKKNDSVTEITKYNAQMLKLLAELGLKANIKIGNNDDDVQL